MSSVEFYAVSVSFEGRELRYAQRRWVEVRTDEYGNSFPAVYLPYLQSVSAPSAEIDFEGRFPTPRASLKISDAGRELGDFFSNIDAEAAEAALYALDVDGNVLSSLDGYITDLSFSEGVSSASFLASDDKAGELISEFFQEDSFQWFDLLKPVDVNVQPSFELLEDIPWRTIVGSRVRTNIDQQVIDFSGVGQGKFEPQSAVNGCPGGGVHWFIRLVNTGDTGNLYKTYTFAEGFFVRVALLSNPETYTIEYDAAPVVTASVTTDGTIDTIEEVLEELESQLNAGGVNAYYDPVDQQLWVEGDPTDLVLANCTFDDEHLSVFYDPDAPGAYVVPQERRENRFVNSGGAAYELAHLGNAEFTETCEMIAYAYVLQGQVWDPRTGSLRATEDDNWYLSGIPSTEDNNPTGDFADVTALDPSIGSAAEFLAAYGVKNAHVPFETIAPAGKPDRIWVDSGGLSPMSLDDPKLGVGFLSFGDTISNNNREMVTFHRYRMTAIHDNVIDPVFDGTISAKVFELEIHNRFKDTELEYAVNSLQGSFEIRKERFSEDQRVFLANWQSTLVSMDILLTGYSGEVESRLGQESERAALIDRYRGYRVEMIGDIQDLREVVSEQLSRFGDNVDRQQIVALNSRMVNNTSGRFAVCTGSKIVRINNEYLERLFFFDSYDGFGAEPFAIEQSQLEGEIDPDSVEPISGLRTQNGREVFYSNYLVYDSSYATAEEMATEDVFSQGSDFFLKGSYRVLHDPVPQNSQDLGRMFPIVYGSVRRVPVLHVQSKKPVAGVDTTAGDDLYIYASHKCDVARATDIVIEIEEGDKLNESPQDVEGYSLNLAPHIVKSPFPTSVADHFEVTEEIDGVNQIISAKSKTVLMNPYHELARVKTLDGFDVFGFRLRGYQWDYRLGQLDKRYPVRNGLGSSKLFASFGGLVDSRGELVRHPVDIFIDYVRRFGRWPYNERFLDLESLLAIKGQTGHYAAAVFLDEPMEVGAFLEELFKVFALFPYVHNGALRLARIDLDYVDYTKPISENFNLLEGVEEDSKYLKNSYDRVTVSFNYNYISEKFEDAVELTPLNNLYCARAARSKGGRRELKIESKWLYSPRVARESAQIYARLLSQRRVEYTLQVKDRAGISWVPGDVVPMTFSRYSLDASPVVVMSVEPSRSVTKLRVMKIG